MGDAVITSLYFITFCYMLYIIYLLYEYTINILIILCCINLGFPRGSVGKNLLAEQMTQVRSLGQEDILEREMATHCSVLTWRIP